MISVGLARRLRDGGLRWEPAAGDRFVVIDRGMDDEVFTLAEMTVEVHDIPGAGRLLGFNGTTEWALDSVQASDALWLPAEGQLRDRLGGTFRALRRTIDDRYEVELDITGRPFVSGDADAAEAYGHALLHLITGE
jgi:hypothetical protein